MHDFSSDPYEILEIAQDATQREVKQAYRRLAMQFHPDHNPEKPEAEARFKQVQQAYEALTGRRKQAQISPAAFYQRNYPPSFFKNEHPFFSFYWAMKTFAEPLMKNMKPPSKQDDKEQMQDD